MSRRGEPCPARGGGLRRTAQRRRAGRVLRLRSDVIDDCGDGLGDLVPMVDDNLFGLSIDERISDQAGRWTARMLRLGEPTAVFVTQPGVGL